MNEVLKITTTRYPELEACIPEIEAAFELMRVSFSQCGKLLLCGNGGSAADCECCGRINEGVYVQTTASSINN